MDVPQAAERIADELLASGARAVWLAGSHARGEAGPHSDIDLGAVYEDPPAAWGPPRQRRDGHLASIAWVTAEQTRDSFHNPALLGAAVPGWRRALLLRDPSGIGAALRDEALRWSWQSELEVACDRWAATQVEIHAEYAQKVHGCLHRGNLPAAAAHRSLLVAKLALAMSVRRRLLYGGENELLESVATSLGEPWASDQAAALGLAGEALDESCAAALRLYATAAADVGPLLDDRQRAIVEPAAALARG